MIRTLVVDDEVLARQGIVARLAEEADFEVVGEAGAGEAAVTAIQATHPDLVFLDVRLPELDGFEVLARAGGEHLPAVVFVTAYDRYAVKAFDAHALDYLLKPVSDTRFHDTLARIRHVFTHDVRLQDRQQRLANALESAPAGAPTQLASDGSGRRYLTRFVIKDRGRFFFVKTARIDWFESAANYVELHAEGRTHLMRMTMGELEERLDPSRFARIHRARIVNIDRVQEVQSHLHGDYSVILVDGRVLRMGRAYRSRLL